MPTSTRRPSFCKMPHDAEQPGTAQPPAAHYAASSAHMCAREGSNVAVGTKLRAETSEIVGSVANYCKELDEGSASNREKQTSPYRTNSDEFPPSKIRAETAPSEGENGAQMPTDVASATRSEQQEDGGNKHKSCDDGENVELRCGWAPLELPPLQLEAFWDADAALKQSGEDWLGRIVAMHDALVSSEQCTPTDGLTLWRFWEGRDGFAAERSISSIKQKLQSPEKELSTLNSPRRMQSDWCEAIGSGENFLHDESNTLLRRMIRVNTQATFLVKDIVVPNVFEGDWGRSLVYMRPPRSIMEGGGEIQHLLLPYDLVREDDAKVTDAPFKLVSTADSYLRGVQRSDVSLMKASMNTPSVWNHAVVVDRLTELIAEKPKTMMTPPNEYPASPQGHPPGMLQQAVTARSDPHGNTSTPRNYPSTAKKTSATNGSLQVTQLHPVGVKLAVATEDNPLSTDYFLSDKFLNCNWSESPEGVGITVREDTNSSDTKDSPQYEQFLQQIARPALWDLMRKKLIQVSGVSFQNALNCISLETLEAIIYQQFRDVKKMSLNPSAASSVEIIETCASLRQAAWLHTLRIVSIGQMAVSRNGDMMPAVLAKIIPSAKYKLVLGPSNWKDLYALLEAIGGNAVSLNATSHPSLDTTTTSTPETEQIIQPPHKKRKVNHMEQEVTTQVRVLCSIQFLEQDELLDELCTEQRIFFIERDLPPPIDILVDERNCICVLNAVTFQVEANVRNFIFGLARLQVQFQKCWIIIVFDAPASGEMEVVMNLFYAALVQFRIEIQVFTSFSCEEASCYVRAVVDECADIALNCRRVLPRLWFERPFLLEEESQFERFLVSTKIVNHYAAQSLLHKLCMEDLFTKRIDKLKALVQNAVTDEQLQLLWGLVQQDHGLNSVME